MLNFHWMARDRNLSVEELKNLSNSLEDLGYKSLLLLVNSNQPDNWIKAAHAINPQHKLKYLVALRPYMISATLCSMMVKGFNEISPNRLSFNIVSGQILEDERPPEKVFGVDTDINDKYERLMYIEKFLEDLYKILPEGERPEVVVGTGNKKVIDIAKRYTDISLCMYDDFKKNDLSFFKKKMVSIHVLLRDTEDEADTAMLKFKGTRQAENIIYGTKESVINKILKLEDEGITDVLISITHEESDPQKIYEIVKDIPKN